MCKTFAISFVDKSGARVSDPSSQDTSNTIPVLEVIVCSPGDTSGQGVHCNALVDTGADYAVVDKSLITQLGGTLVRAVSNKGATGEVNTTVHDITFLLTATNGEQIALHSDVVATDSPHAVYPVILGRSFFRHGALLFDYTNGKFEFKT